MTIIKLLFVLMIVLPFAALLGYLLMRMAQDFNDAASETTEMSSGEHRSQRARSGRRTMSGQSVERDRKRDRKADLKRDKKRDRKRDANRVGKMTSNKRNDRKGRKTVYNDSYSNDFTSYPKDPYADFKRPDFDKQIKARMKNNE